MKHPASAFVLWLCALICCVFCGWRAGRRDSISVTTHVITPDTVRKGQVSSLVEVATGAPVALTDAEFDQLLQEVAGLIDAGTLDGKLEDFATLRAAIRVSLLANSASVPQKARLRAALERKQRGEVAEALEMFASLLRPADDIRTLQAFLTGPGNDDEKTLRVATAVDADPLGVAELLVTELLGEQPAPWAAQSLELSFAAAARVNASRALELVESIRSRGAQKQALEGVGRALPRLYGADASASPSDRDELVRRYVAASFSAGQSPASTLSAVVRTRLANEDSATMLHWVDSLGFPPDESWLRQAVAAGWASSAPEKAYDWLMDGTTPAEAPTTFEAVVKRWCSPPPAADPAEAVARASEWLISRGLGPETDLAVAHITTAWNNLDEPTAAVEWVRSITNDARRAAALDALTVSLRRKHPETWQQLLAPQ